MSEGAQPGVVTGGHFHLGRGKGVGSGARLGSRWTKGQVVRGEVKAGGDGRGRGGMLSSRWEGKGNR